jgi:predicted aminopeptidase
MLQAAAGQFELFNRARPIAEALADPRLEPRYRRALEEVPAVLKFVQSRGLKPTSSYREFVDLKREAVVWIVSACEPLRFEAQRWGFPVVGSFSYLGWFDRTRALKMRDRLEKAGFDADVRGAQAYSTLGWFRDPVLSTLVGNEQDPFGFIETLIHESVHATLHLHSQSALNESLAQFVAEKLTPEYLGSEQKRRYGELLVRARGRKAALRKAYQELETIYASAEADARKLELKRERLERLRAELSWPDSRGLNNATLIQFATYESGGEAFESLWSACGGELRAFLRVIGDAEQELARAGDAGFGGVLAGLGVRCQK